MANLTLRLFTVLFLIAASLGHICVIYPPQRGGANINGPGSHSCFQPTAPCGTAAPSPPTITLSGGSTFYVLVQQNLNHYNPGNPGFIDIGYSVGTNQTSDAEFITLATIPDYWPHFQGSQTNFSIPFSVPNIDCSWCTLQVRYHPNKPTEPIFHNCVDIAISSKMSITATGRIIGVAKPGPSYSTFDDLSSFATVDYDTGAVQRLSPTPYHIGLRSVHTAPPVEFLNKELFIVANGLVAPLEQTDIYYFLSRSSSSLQLNPFTQLSEFSIGHFNYTSVLLQFPNGIDQWSGLISSHSKSTPAPLILIGQTVTNNIYTFSAFWLTPEGNISSPIGTTLSDSTFVNFFWADYNPCAGSNGVVYILSGDENSLTTLDVTLYSIDVATGAVNAVLVNNTQYTISSIHVWLSDCEYLYTLSPGLVNDSPSSRVWSLLKINPVTGAIVSAYPVTQPGLYNDYYGGAVYGYSITSNNQLLYQLQRTNDGSFDLVSVNLETHVVDSQTAINLGVNGAYSLSSVMYTPY